MYKFKYYVDLPLYRKSRSVLHTSFRFTRVFSKNHLLTKVSDSVIMIVLYIIYVYGIRNFGV